MKSGSSAARLLGSLGGRARARRLSKEERRDVAARGGRARAKSLKIARLVEENFRYLGALQDLSKVTK